MVKHCALTCYILQFTTSSYSMISDTNDIHSRGLSEWRPLRWLITILDSVISISCEKLVLLSDPIKKAIPQCASSKRCAPS